MELGEQQEIDGIDNTPLAAAVKRAAEVKKTIDKLEDELEKQNEIVFKKMQEIGKDNMFSHGFHFVIERKPETKRLKMKRA